MPAERAPGSGLGMGYNVQLADEASHDLDGIVAYLCEVLAAPAAATELLDAYDAFVDVIEEYPEAYEKCTDLHLARLGYRKASLKGCVALYRTEKNEVVVSRIFHQSQDYARLV